MFQEGFDFAGHGKIKLLAVFKGKYKRAQWPESGPLMSRSGPLTGVLARIWDESEVSRMAEIYRSAASVLVWLGECDEYSGQAIELISVLASLPLKTPKELNPENMNNANVVLQRLGSSFTPQHWISF
jgi:hypothetical protein